MATRIKLHLAMISFLSLVLVGTLYLEGIEACIADGTNFIVMRNRFPGPKCVTDYLYQHYETKRCTPVIKEGEDCPIRFDCPEKMERSKNECFQHGKTYKIGKEFDCDNPCYKCKCVDSPDGAIIKYTKKECFVHLSARIGRDDCYYNYEMNKCCPTNVTCDTSKLQCKWCKWAHDMKEYVQTKFPNIFCICSLEWLRRGMNEECVNFSCQLDNYFDDMKKGCVPIYHYGLCCPTRFHCARGVEEIIHTSKSDNSDPKMQCVFNNLKGNIGDTLDLKLPKATCTNCTCTVPPDFTCVKTATC